MKAGQNFLGVCPRGQLAPNPLLWADPGKMVNDAVVFAQVQVPSASVLVSCNSLDDHKVGEVAGGEGFSGADDVLWCFPIGVPADGDGVCQVVLGDIEEGVEQAWLDDLVSIGEEGVGVAKGEKVLSCRCPVLDLALPLTNNNSAPRCLR